MWTCGGVRPGQGGVPGRVEKKRVGVGRWEAERGGVVGGGQGGRKRLQRQKAKALAERGARPGQTRRAARAGRSDAEETSGRRRRRLRNSSSGHNSNPVPARLHVNNYSGRRGVREGERSLRAGLHCGSLVDWHILCLCVLAITPANQ